MAPILNGWRVRGQRCPHEVGTDAGSSAKADQNRAQRRTDLAPRASGGRGTRKTALNREAGPALLVWVRTSPRRFACPRRIA
jgi:hypothetical protein